MSELPFCECGCGERVTKDGNRFINGHNSRGEGNPSKQDDVRKKKSDAMKGRTFSDETIEKMRKSAKLRPPLSDEHRANLSKSAKLRPPITDETRAKLSRPKSDEHKLTISKAKTGVPREPFSDEWKAAMSASQIERCKDPEEIERRSKMTSGENNGMHGKNHSEESIIKMRESAKDKHGGDKNGMYGVCGGMDIVQHHYIYDESDLSKYTVGITRSDHMRLHRLLQKLGYIVPHINVKEDN